MNKRDKFEMDATIVRIVANIGVILILFGVVISKTPNYSFIGFGVFITIVAFGLLKFWLRAEKYT